MARKPIPRPRCGSRWTEARYQGFIKNQLRSATRKWAPISDCLKKARLRRGFYRCADCPNDAPTSIKVGNKRMKNISVDHIRPIVPVTGWVGWDHYIDSMFCEEENLQVLCKACHDKKSAGEAGQRKIHRRSK